MIRNTRCPVLSGRAVLSPDSRGAAAEVCGAEFWVTVTLLWVRRRGVAKASPRPVLGLYGAAAPFGTPVRPAATPRQHTCRIRQRNAGFSGIPPRVRAPPAVWGRSADARPVRPRLAGSVGLPAGIVRTGYPVAGELLTPPGQQGHIGTYENEPRAVVGIGTCHLRVERVDAHGCAGRRGGRESAPHRLDHVRMGLLPEQPHGSREIGGTHEYAVDPGHGGDLLGRLHACGGLHLHDHA